VRSILFPTHRSRSLFFILILERERAMSREHLFDLLWPSSAPAQPKRALNNELWRLRKTLSGGGLDAQRMIISDAETVAYKANTGIDVDLYLFNDATQKAITGGPSAQGAALEAERLYKGELLAGVYDDWCLTPREACRASLLEAMESLLKAQVEERNWHGVIRTGRRIVTEDPLLEHVHREIMRSFAHLGDRAAAARQFEELQAKLEKELGVDPSPESTALREALRSDQNICLKNPTSLGSSNDEIIQRLEAVTDALHEAEKKLALLRDAISRTVN